MTCYLPSLGWFDTIILKGPWMVSQPGLILPPHNPVLI